jgi:hypothetical protein
MMKNKEDRVKGWLIYRLVPRIYVKDKDNVYFFRRSLDYSSHWGYSTKKMKEVTGI